MPQEIIGRLGWLADRPHCTDPTRPDGSANLFFPADTTREQIAKFLRASGYVLRDDDTVLRLDG